MTLQALNINDEQHVPLLIYNDKYVCMSKNEGVDCSMCEGEVNGCV